MKTEKINTYFNGDIDVNVISHQRELPKTARLIYCDYVRNDDDTMGNEVNVYATKSRFKYYALIKRN